MGLFRRKLKEGRDFFTQCDEEYIGRMKAARESSTRAEWKLIRREYIGMIYAALKAMPHGFGRCQNDNDMDKAIALADKLIEKIKENEKITGYE